MKKKVIYRDEMHESKIKADLETAKPLVQAVLDEWNQLDIGQCPDVFQLLTQPEKSYKDAITSLIEVPETTGRFQISKQAYAETLETPDPTTLYSIIRTARKNQLTVYPDLWQIQEGEIIINETEGEKLINGRTIYSDDAAKIQLIEDLQKFTDLMNSINERLRGDFANPYDRDFFAGKFNLNQVGTGVYKVEILHDYLQLLLR